MSYSGVTVWNSIPVNIKESSSLPIFIHNCTEWILSIVKGLLESAIMLRTSMHEINV